MTQARKNHLMQVALNWAIYCITILGLIALFFTGPKVEALLYPVIASFEITNVWTENGQILVSGALYKNRGECAPQSLTMSVYGDQNDINAKIVLIDTSLSSPQPGVSLRHRPSGPQLWGPWILTPPEPPLGPLTRIVMTYRCHFMWTIEQVIYEGETADIFPLDIITGEREWATPSEASPEQH